MKYVVAILFFFALFSCNGIKQKEKTLSALKEWIGKEIIYPENLFFTRLGVDTLSNEMQSKYHYKVFSYVDSTGCTSCKLQLTRWKAFIAEMDSVSEGKCVIHFIFHSKKVPDIIYTLKYNNYKLPVCLDENDSFNKLNHFPADMMFQTFLLDKENKVLAIGNPIHNPKVKELYLNIIQGEKVEREDKGRIIKTKVNIDKTSVSMGNFDWPKEQKATFSFQNTGDKPLVIEAANTSCGCITVEYPKEPEHPGGSLDLHVTYKADHPEHFNKTITVYCNVESSPIKLSISGNAE